MTLSARNRLEGKVVEIQFGGVMAHVVMRVGKRFIESVFTKRSADEVKLKVGDKALSRDQVHKSDVGKELKLSSNSPLEKVHR
jgi:molybdopterin-binding protein